MNTLTIATRGSQLALWQAEHVKYLILKQHPKKIKRIELLVLKTKGDIILDVPLAKVGGKGLFVKEIEQALLDGRADLAVHSMKDLPMQLPQGLVLGAISEREDPRDVFLSVDYKNIDALPIKAKIGTSSLRRQAQLLSIRPDLNILPLRGNVGTRLEKLMQGQFAAIIMAAAGIKRLDLRAPYLIPIPTEVMLPAVGQGALGVEYLEGRSDLAELLKFIDHKKSRLCVEAERAFLTEMEGSCQVPMAAYATFADGLIKLQTFISSIDGKDQLEETDFAFPEKAVELGFNLAKKLKAAGGNEILKSIFSKI